MSEAWGGAGARGLGVGGEVGGRPSSWAHPEVKNILMELRKGFPVRGWHQAGACSSLAGWRQVEAACLPNLSFPREQTREQSSLTCFANQLLALQRGHCGREPRQQHRAGQVSDPEPLANIDHLATSTAGLAGGVTLPGPVAAPLWARWAPLLPLKHHERLTAALMATLR